MKPIHKFAKENLELLKSVSDKFSNTSRSVDLVCDYFKNMPVGVSTEIAEGVFFRMASADSVSWHGRCSMRKGSFLKIRFHSDYDEDFSVLKGVIYDSVSMKQYSEGERFRIRAGVSHLISCREESLLDLTGNYRTQMNVI